MGLSRKPKKVPAPLLGGPSAWHHSPGENAQIAAKAFGNGTRENRNGGRYRIKYPDGSTSERMDPAIEAEWLKYVTSIHDMRRADDSRRQNQKDIDAAIAQVREDILKRPKTEETRKIEQTSLIDSRRSLHPAREQLHEIKLLRKKQEIVLRETDADYARELQAALKIKQNPQESKREFFARKTKFWSKPSEEKQLAILRTTNRLSKLLQNDTPFRTSSHTEQLMYDLLRFVPKERLNELVPKIAETAAKSRSGGMFFVKLNTLIQRDKTLDQNLVSQRFLDDQTRKKAEAKPRGKRKALPKQEIDLGKYFSDRPLQEQPRQGLNKDQIGELRKRAILNKKLDSQLEKFGAKREGSAKRRSTAQATLFWKKSPEEKEASLMRTINKFNKRGKPAGTLTPAEKVLFNTLDSINGIRTAGEDFVFTRLAALHENPGALSEINRDRDEAQRLGQKRQGEKAERASRAIAQMAGESKNEREFVRKLRALQATLKEIR